MFDLKHLLQMILQVPDDAWGNSEAFNFKQKEILERRLGKQMQMQMNYIETMRAIKE